MIKKIPYGSHEEWLEIRRNYIGGSDAGAIIGLNPYSSPFSVWAEKTGNVPEFEGNVITETGKFLEEFVAGLFTKETGKKVRKCNFTLVNDLYPWACANLDRTVDGEDAILEIKTTNSRVNVKRFRQGEYPEVWYAQMTHYLAVTGKAKAYLAVLIECREFRIFELDRDEDEIKALMDAEQAFWEKYVIPRKMPPADGSDATTETIRKLWQTDDGETVDLYGLDGVFQQIDLLNGQIKALNTQKDELINQIKVQMGSSPKATCGKWNVSWRNQGTGGLDRDAMKKDWPGIDFSKYSKQTRVFRITERKAR